MQKFIDRTWYAPLIGLLAALDNFIVIIPNDGILISSAMLLPKQWLRFSFFDALGSTVGAVALAYVVQVYGIQIVDVLFPGLQATRGWILTSEFFNQYGLWLLFLVAVTPFVQQPAIVFSVIAMIPIFQIGLIIFIGRFIKFSAMSYIGSHAPHLLQKFWGASDELKDVGVDLKP